MATFNAAKVVLELPDELLANTVYYVRRDDGFDTYITNSVGEVVAYPQNPQEWNAETVTLEEAVEGESVVRKAWTAERVHQAAVSANIPHLLRGAPDLGDAPVITVGNVPGALTDNLELALELAYDYRAWKTAPVVMIIDPDFVFPNPLVFDTKDYSHITLTQADMGWEFGAHLALNNDAIAPTITLNWSTYSSLLPLPGAHGTVVFKDSIFSSVTLLTTSSPHLDPIVFDGCLFTGDVGLNTQNTGIGKISNCIFDGRITTNRKYISIHDPFAPIWIIDGATRIQSLGYGTSTSPKLPWGEVSKGDTSINSWVTVVSFGPQVRIGGLPIPELSLAHGNHSFPPDYKGNFFEPLKAHADNLPIDTPPVLIGTPRVTTLIPAEYLDTDFEYLDGALGFDKKIYFFPKSFAPNQLEKAICVITADSDHGWSKEYISAELLGQEDAIHTTYPHEQYKAVAITRAGDFVLLPYNADKPFSYNIYTKELRVADVEPGLLGLPHKWDKLVSIDDVVYGVSEAVTGLAGKWVKGVFTTSTVSAFPKIAEHHNHFPIFVQTGAANNNSIGVYGRDGWPVDEPLPEVDAGIYGYTVPGTTSTSMEYIPVQESGIKSLVAPHAGYVTTLGESADGAVELIRHYTKNPVRGYRGTLWEWGFKTNRPFTPIQSPLGTPFVIDQLGVMFEDNSYEMQDNGNNLHHYYAKPEEVGNNPMARIVSYTSTGSYVFWDKTSNTLWTFIDPEPSKFSLDYLVSLTTNSFYPKTGKYS